MTAAQPTGISPKPAQACKPSPGTHPLLLFDGDCGLCNALVRLLLRVDRAAIIRFAPLQGVTGQATLLRLGLPVANHESLVYLPDARGQAHALRTDGVIAVLDRLGGIWRLGARVLRLIPPRLRDRAYKLVARWRHALFGVRRPRGLPDPAWEERVLK